MSYSIIIWLSSSHSHVNGILPLETTKSRASWLCPHFLQLLPLLRIIFLFHLKLNFYDGPFLSYFVGTLFHPVKHPVRVCNVFYKPSGIKACFCTKNLQATLFHLVDAIWRFAKITSKTNNLLLFLWPGYEVFFNYFKLYISNRIEWTNKFIENNIFSCFTNIQRHQI